MRPLLAASGLVVLLASASSSAAPHAKTAPPVKAAAAPVKRPSVCAVAYQNAQAREEAGRLREARELALSCAKTTCGATLMQQCTAMFAQLDSDVPTFVPMAADEGGTPRTDVEVRVDGELATLQLDGHALPIDPGVHEITFTTDSGYGGEQKFAL